jgi:hypothetical protein
MSVSAYDRIPTEDWDLFNFNFNTFKSAEDFLKQVVDINESQDDYFRTATQYKNVFEDEKYQNTKQYEKYNQLDSKLEEFEQLFDQIDMGGAFKKKKLKITDDKRGIFSFSLASKGLYRGVEYYSEEIKVDNPKELVKYGKPLGVVTANLVENIFIGGEKQFLYTSSSTNKTYSLTRQQEGTANVIEANPNAILKETSGGLKYPEPQSFGNVGVKFKTSTKKSYLMFDKKGGKAEMVELFTPVNVELDYTNVVPVFLIAKYLVSMGIRVKINAIRVFKRDGRTEYFMWSIPIKDYGEEMDFGKMALIGLEKKWWWLIKVGIQTFLRLNNSQFDARGYPAKNEADNIETFARYRNWYEEQINLGFVEPLRVDKKLLIFSAIGRNMVKPNANEYKEQVMQEFYRVMDRIDFYYNKADKVVERIYKREVEKKSEESFNKDIDLGVDYQQALLDYENYKKSLTSNMKIYTQQILSDTYTYPKGGQYAESSESAQMMEDEFDEKLDELNKFLKTI